jgi:hypothetical protein
MVWDANWEYHKIYPQKGGQANAEFFLLKISYRNFGEIFIKEISNVSRIDIFEKKNRQFICRKIAKFRQDKKTRGQHSNKSTRTSEREREREREEKKMGTIMRIK